MLIRLVTARQAPDGIPFEGGGRILYRRADAICCLDGLEGGLTKVHLVDGETLIVDSNVDTLARLASA